MHGTRGTAGASGERAHRSLFSFTWPLIYFGGWMKPGAGRNKLTKEVTTSKKIFLDYFFLFLFSKALRSAEITQFLALVGASGPLLLTGRQVTNCPLLRGDALVVATQQIKTETWSTACSSRSEALSACILPPPPPLPLPLLRDLQSSAPATSTCTQRSHPLKCCPGE